MKEILLRGEAIDAAHDLLDVMDHPPRGYGLFCAYLRNEDTPSLNDVEGLPADLQLVVGFYLQKDWINMAKWATQTADFLRSAQGKDEEEMSNDPLMDSILGPNSKEEATSVQSVPPLMNEQAEIDRALSEQEGTISLVLRGDAARNLKALAAKFGRDPLFIVESLLASAVMPRHG